MNKCWNCIHNRFADDMKYCRRQRFKYFWWRIFRRLFPSLRQPLCTEFKVNPLLAGPINCRCGVHPVRETGTLKNTRNVSVPMQCEECTLWRHYAGRIENGKTVWTLGQCMHPRHEIAGPITKNTHGCRDGIRRANEDPS